jgi:hypothetical protein
MRPDIFTFYPSFSAICRQTFIKMIFMADRELARIPRHYRSLRHLAASLVRNAGQGAVREALEA